jgi:Chaperone of endosialidase
MKTRVLSILMILSLTYVGVLPKAEAVSPPPDGGYPGGNTAEGQSALLSLTSGNYNTAVGFLSLLSTTTNSFNTAIGAGALLANTADQNTATGAGALLSNTAGVNNTANGAFALFSNTSGFNNSALGGGALQSNTIGFANTATGVGALLTNTSGNDNTADGLFALYFNTTGSENTAIGENALEQNTVGNTNTAIGEGALFQNTTGSGNVACGFLAGNQVSAANNVIAIGHDGADVSNTTWVGNIYGVSTQSGTTAPVVVSDGGQLGTVASSQRFKKDITTMEKASQSILSLRPVTFHYKSDANNTPHFGLIAEEVAKVNPALVLPDKEGKPYTVRYDAVNAMLLNEFLKEHRRVQELEANAARQENEIKALTAGLQKVTAQLEVSKPPRQTVSNNQ